MKNRVVSKGLVFGIIFLFVGAGAFPSTVGIIERNTNYAKSHSGSYIQDLIDNASIGDTIYIPSGIYYENIIINKSINLIGEDKDTTIIDGGGSGDVVYVSHGWVNISGFTFQNSGSRIYADDADAGIDILSPIISSNNGYGIRLHGDSNIISGNIISNNGNGIFLFKSKFNIIKCNTISNNGRGIFLWESKFNIIKGNTISNNKDGIILTRLSGHIIVMLLVGIDINLISKNNFIDNEQNAYFTNSFFNKWILNYWNKTRILPKLIHGKLEERGCMGNPCSEYSLFNFDWRPALKPYDIKVGI